MYEQSENKYLEGDVVWVKLGSSWWPGQVVGLDKLPEDVQIEFKKKPLIAAVKFFQEDSFEFVKHNQQICKYNCAQKEDFIRKGLDKFRIRSRDHSNYMIKFPKDVKTAEILTNGDPNILSSEKFNPEEKPDVSELFGEKKVFKKKRNREEITRKSNIFMKHNITHPRFIKENDHEIRIRKQPVNHLSTSNTVPQGIYPCQLCGFTATRVNVIICHLKSHRLSGKISATKKTKVKTSELKSEQIELPKRKHVRKSTTDKTKNICSRLGKRKQPKPMENVIKKKKSDPELREKLLADWNIDSDEEDGSELIKSTDVSTYNFLIEKQSNENIAIQTKNSKSEYENLDVFEEPNKLLKEIDNFSSFSTPQNNSNTNADDNKQKNIETSDQVLPVECNKSINFQKTTFQKSCVENENKRSQLSCFDFDEEDVPETSISNVKKIPRGHKNMSIKKEIIKEFELSQTLKTGKASEKANDAIYLDVQDVHSSTSKKAEINLKNENNKRMTSSLQVIETQVEIVEILEIQKEYGEKVAKSEKITEKNLDSKKDEIAKFKNEDSFLKMENSENMENDCEKEKDTIEEAIKESFLENCEKNSSDSLNENNNGFSHNNNCREEQSLLGKTGNDLKKNFDERISSINHLFIDLKNNFFPSVESMVDEKTNSDTSKQIENLSLPPKNDNITLKDRLGRPKKILRANSTTSDSIQNCSYNQKSALNQESSSLTDVGGEKYNEMQQTDEILSETNKTFKDANIKISKKRQENTIEKNGNVQKDVILDRTNSVEPQLTNNNVQNIPNSSETKNNGKNNGVNKSNIFIDDFNNFEKKISISNEDSSEIKQNNVIELLPSETCQIRQLDSVSSEMTGKSGAGNVESDEVSNDKSSLAKSELDAKYFENDSSKTANSKKNNLNNNELNCQQEASCSRVNSSVLEIKVSKGNVCLDNANTVLMSKTFAAIPNLKANSPVAHSDLKSLHGIETVFDDIKGKMSDNVFFISDGKLSQPLLSRADFEINNSSSLNQTECLVTKSNVDLKQHSSSSVLTSSSPLTEDKTTIPVKKREKPRIIENVALKEPMILKTKLREKHSGKIRKHKFEIDSYKSHKIQCDSKAKITKVENIVLHTENESTTKSIKTFAPTINTIKTFQTRDNSLVRLKKNIKNEPLISTSTQASKLVCSQKYIQENPKNVDEMELDIDSMPFVLSEDVLTPESIEHIPVVISTASFVTSAKQKDNFSLSINDSKETALSLKKRSGTPTILKNKNKVKPTITSIKTIVPPLNSAAHKGVYKISTPSQKSSVGNQKFFGKYVIVQTSGNQEAYNIHQKLAIPTCKDSANAQIVQQGGKVVILTSPQSPSQNILPFNSIKALNSGRVKRMVMSKQPQQSSNSPSFHNAAASKTITTSKVVGYNLTPTTSAVTTQKISSLQHNVISKSVLMQCSGTVTKSGILNTSPQSIVTKNSIFAEIDAISAPNKSTVSSKKFFSQKVDTFKDKPSQTIQFSPTSTIIPSQGLISKGTVLTPITGSQVKAFAAKNIKSNKKQFKSIELKMTSPAIHKNQKVLSPSNLTYKNPNTSSNMIVLQQNKSKQTLTLDKKVVEQVTENEPIIAETSSQSFSNTYKKSKVVLKNFEQTIIGEKNVSSSPVSLQNLSSEKNDRSSHCELLKSNSTKNFNLDLDEKLVHRSVIEKNNAETNEDLEKVALSSAHKLSSMSISSSLSSTIDISKMHHNQTDSEKILHENFISTSLTSKQDAKQADIKNILISKEENLEKQKSLSETQVVALSAENSCGSQGYVLVTVDEHGNIFPLDNNALMSIDAISNEKNRALYIDTNSLNESENVNNIILQIENETLTNLESTNAEEPSHLVINKASPLSDIAQTTNHDILAAALANTDFQQEIGLTNTSLPMSNFTQTSLINQTILQSTIIPPTDPISSPLVLETSLTLNQPIMTPLEVPKSSLQMSRNSLLNIEKNKETISESPLENKMSVSSVQYDMDISRIGCHKKNSNKSTSLVDSSCSASKKLLCFNKERTKSSMPIIDDAFVTNSRFNSSGTLIIPQNITENDKINTNQDQMHSTDTSTIQTCTPLQTVKLERPELIANNVQDTFVLSENTFDINTKKLKIGIIDSSIEYIDKIGQDHLCDASQVCEKIEENIEQVESKKCTKTDMIQKVELPNVSNKANEDVLTVTKSIAPFERMHSKSPEKMYSRNETKNKIIDSEIEASNKISRKIVDADSTTQKYKDKQVAQNQGHQSKIMLQEEESNPMNESKLLGNKDGKESISSMPCNQPPLPTHTDLNISNRSAIRNKKSEVQETTHSIKYEIIETEEKILTEEPAAELCQKLKIQKLPTSVVESHKTLDKIDNNADVPKITLFNKKETRSQENNHLTDNCEATFSTQNFEIIKINNSFVDVNTEVESSQEEVNTPLLANEIGADIIGTVSVLNTNSGLNDDEIASSSYVPETPENQERDQDQESAISTSSYEILPCEELNIAPSSITPDTSMHGEFPNIDNSVIIDMPDMSDISDLPTSSCSLNSDSSVAGAELTSTSNFSNEIAIQQNISPPYEVPVPTVNLKESTPVSNVSKKIDSDAVATATLGVSRSYLKLNKKEITPSFSEPDLVIDYYGPKSSAQSSNSYYSNNLDEQCLEEGLESSPCYIDSYSANYAAVTSSSSERHDLVDSSDPAKTTDR